MDSAFYELFGQIGATVIAIAFTLLVGYMLYIKEQRDRTGNQIVGLKREMFSIFAKILETPIPGVMQSLTSSTAEGEERRNRLSIAEWAAGTSWEMRVQVGQVNASDVWNRVREGLENLFRGILPDGSYPPIEIDSELFRKWAKNFIDDTEPIRWFTHEYAGYSWARFLLEKMREWEINHPNPVLKSQDVALLFERIMILRQLANQDLLLESNYQNLKFENAIGNYKIVIGALLAMGYFSIFMPLMILLFPPANGEYFISIAQYLLPINVQYLSLAILLLFILCSFLAMWVLIKTAKK